MANEQPGEKPMENPTEKPTTRRPRRRSGRSSRPQGDPAERKSAPLSEDPATRNASAQPGNSADRKSTPSPGTPSDQKSAPRQNNRPERRNSPQQGNRSERKNTPPQGNRPEVKSFPRWTLRDYLLQLSVVIVGIMVTFIGSGLITRWSHARELRATIELVSEELKTNREQVELCCQRLLFDRQGMLMFNGYNQQVDAIPLDSLNRYQGLIGQIRGISIQSDALEVLKTAGLIQSIGDKELLMQILGCYRRMDAFASSVDDYNQRKTDALNHLFAGMQPKQLALFSTDDVRESWRLMLDDPMCSSFVRLTTSYFGNEDTLWQKVSQIDSTLAAIYDKYALE